MLIQTQTRAQIRMQIRTLTRTKTRTQMLVQMLAQTQIVLAQERTQTKAITTKSEKGTP